jgi:hypothetical protein
MGFNSHTVTYSELINSLAQGNDCSGIFMSDDMLAIRRLTWKRAMNQTNISST